MALKIAAICERVGYGPDILGDDDIVREVIL
jgi:hypothetical protein